MMKKQFLFRLCLAGLLTLTFFTMHTGGDKYQVGKKTLQELTGREEKGPKTGYAAFAPPIDTFLKEHLFADLFSRDVPTWQQRELVTVSVLASLPGLQAQLQSHMGICLNIGIKRKQLEEMMQVIEQQVGKSKGDAGRVMLDRLRPPEK